ncbi:MAG: hypothetical protein ACTSUR_08645 [Candidatus Heimdallarchaeaceae archaeon]
MKILKFIIGLLLFITPIALFNSPSNGFFMLAPLGGFAKYTSGGSLAFHNLKFYSHDGIINYLINDYGETLAKTMIAIWYVDLGSQTMNVPGIFTTITLYALAIYLILTFFDKKEVAIASDLLMLACFVLSIVAFSMNQETFSFFYDLSIPIFTIISGILAILGFVFSIKTKARKRKKK